MNITITWFSKVETIQSCSGAQSKKYTIAPLQLFYQIESTCLNLPLSLEASSPAKLKKNRSNPQQPYIIVYLFDLAKNQKHLHSTRYLRWKSSKFCHDNSNHGRHLRQVSALNQTHLSFESCQMSCHAKSCDLDPIPTSMVKECIDIIDFNQSNHKTVSKRR